jgi:hypothetical protein
MCTYYSSGRHGNLGVGDVLQFIYVAKLNWMKNTTSNDAIVHRHKSQVTSHMVHTHKITMCARVSS